MAKSVCRWPTHRFSFFGAISMWPTSESEFEWKWTTTLWKSEHLMDFCVFQTWSCNIKTRVTCEKLTWQKHIYIYMYIEQTLVTSNGNSFFTPQICRCILSLSFIFPHKKNIGPRIPINHQDEYTPLGSLWCQCKPSSRLHPGRPHPHQKSTSCFATYHSLPRFM